MNRTIADVCAVLLVSGAASAPAGQDLGNIGTFAKWAKVEIVLTGPASKAAGEPNPFAIPVDVVFRGPKDQSCKVPGFYDGDGAGGPDGRVWKVRFSADAPGQWSFASSSPDGLLNGCTGSFTVTPPPAEAADFYRWGRLERAAEARYLKFRDGPYWLKAGCDDPENFLGKFRNYDTPAKRKAAIDYLAARGINSLYIMTHTLEGDHKDVWPWLGDTPAAAKANAGPAARFDIPRLTGWAEVFEHMQARGVAVYLVLEDDSAWTGHDYGRYYREIVARFAHLPALLFNFCEEHDERHKLPAALAMMRRLKAIDPYDHPRGIHNVNAPTDAYVDAAEVDFTSIQTTGKTPLMHNQLAIDWINRCRARGRRPLVVNFDEGRPELDRRAWWAAYLGGGVWEAHTVKPYDRPMSAWAKTWTELGGARRFMESLPFWKMDPANALVVAGKAFCLAEPGRAYALYLPEGGQVSVALPPGKYDAAWWDPANGWEGKFAPTAAVEGGPRSFTAPGPGDWALRIVRAE